MIYVRYWISVISFLRSRILASYVDLISYNNYDRCINYSFVFFGDILSFLSVLSPLHITFLNNIFNLFDFYIKQALFFFQIELVLIPDTLKFLYKNCFGLMEFFVFLL